MKRPVFAVIDIGTNSIKLLVGRPSPRGVDVVAFRRETTRAGANVGRSRHITRTRISATATAIRRFARVASRHGATNIVAIATYAFRHASNGKPAASAITRATGIPVGILSGREEARLAYLSARAHVASATHDAVIVDIGGGSTEVIIAESGCTLRTRSLPLGALHLTEKYIRSDPIDASEFATLSGAVEKIVGKMFSGFSMAPPRFDLILSGGTATTGRNMVGRHRDRITSAEVKQLLMRCIASTLSQRRRMPGLPTDRADIMPAGLAIISAVLSKTGKRVARINDGGIREGFLLDTFGGYEQ